MKPILILVAASCVATFVVASSPVPALAQCEPLKSRLHQATELESIHRRNAANRRELFNEVYAEWSEGNAILSGQQAKCDKAGPGSFDCGMVANYWQPTLGPTLDATRRRLDRIQADLDEVSAKLETTVAEKKYVSGELDKCIQKEAAAAEARKKANQAAARDRSKAKARARQRAADKARRAAEEAARAAAAAAAIGAMMGTMGRRGVSPRRPPTRRGGACPPGMRRSADNPNCHYPRGRR